MSNLLNDLLENVHDSSFDKIGKFSGIPKKESKNIIKDIFSILLRGISKNIQDQKQSKKFLKILKRDHSNNLNNIDIILNGLLNKKSDKIIKHILNDEKDNVFKKVSKFKKLNNIVVEKLFEKTAPVFMGSLFKTIDKAKINNEVFPEILRMAYEADLNNSKLLLILDQNKDGHIIDDIFGFVKKLIFGKR